MPPAGLSKHTLKRWDPQVCACEGLGESTMPLMAHRAQHQNVPQAESDYYASN